MQWLYIYIHRVGTTTIQHIACTGSWSWPPVSWLRWKWETLCLEWNSNPHLWHSVSSVPPLHNRLPDVTTIPTPTCLCGSLPQRSVQTATLLLLFHWLSIAVKCSIRLSVSGSRSVHSCMTLHNIAGLKPDLTMLVSHSAPGECQSSRAETSNAWQATSPPGPLKAIGPNWLINSSAVFSTVRLYY